MKKVLLCFALFVCVFTSCKKNNSSSGAGNYHFTATVDGQAMTFNVSPLAVNVTNNGYSIIGIEGFAGSASATQVMALSWTNAAPGSAKFTTGSYTDTATTYSITANYNPSASQAFVAGNGVVGFPGTNSGVNHLKITIASVDSTAIKGTFSGDFYLNGDINQAKKVVTNGDFFVPWKK